MSDRSTGVTALALLATVQGIYAFVTGIALMFGGTIGAFAGAESGMATTVLGALFLSISAVSFGLGGGFWMHKSWSWFAGILVYGASIGINLATVLVGASIISVIMPVALGAGVIWFLLQPRTKAELVGTEAAPAPTP
ncbi:hypothetical protein BH23CHL8_BH23CHL8_19360 [soil metagenome]